MYRHEIYGSFKALAKDVAAHGYGKDFKATRRQIRAADRIAETLISKPETLDELGEAVGVLVSNGNGTVAQQARALLDNSMDNGRPRTRIGRERGVWRRTEELYERARASRIG